MRTKTAQTQLNQRFGTPPVLRCYSSILCDIIPRSLNPNTPIYKGLRDFILKSE